MGFKKHMVLLMIMTLCLMTQGVSAQSIDQAGADIELLPSTYYSHSMWKACTYVINHGDVMPWGQEMPCLGTPDRDNDGREWYQQDYSLTNGEAQWEETHAPYYSADDYKGMPAYVWTTDNVAADIYIRRTFKLTGPLPGKVYLACGHDDGESQFYINGTLVFASGTEWENSKYIELDKEQKALLKTDGTDNLIAVHVHNNYGGAFADCGLYGKDVPSKEKGNLPFGFEEPWTGRVLFNSEGGYAYNSTNVENSIHGWSKLYEASSSDEYEIYYPTPSLEAGNARAQFRTSIYINRHHIYNVRIGLQADKDVDDVQLILSETDNDNAALCDKTTSLTAGKSKTITFQGITGSEINALQLAVNAGTKEEGTRITVKGINIYDTTDNKELWDGCSYFNYCRYINPQNGERIKDMNISGRQETKSWTQADYDDSMWPEALMPVGNAGYMGEVRTIWPGNDNTNYWVRRDFDLEEVKATTQYLLRVCHDDCYTIYVNGHLMDTDTGWTDGKNYVEIEIPSRFLKEGRNVIATYIQQNWGGRFYDCSLKAIENVYEEGDAGADATKALIATEVEVSNIDQTLDYSFNYGGWLELYNNSDLRVSLDFLYISDDSTRLDKFVLQKQGVIQPHSYKCVFFDHNASDGVYGSTADKQVPFKLQNDGGSLYLSEDGVTAFMKIDYPSGIMRCSWARKAIDSDEWGYNGTPTPAAENSRDFAEMRLPAPAVDTDSRLFDEGFTVKVDIPMDARLLYTTDGTAPTLDNGTESGEGIFNINETTSLRLRLFKEGYLPGPVVTRTYIKRDKDYYLPVICVTTKADNLYGDSIGVYVDGVNGVEGRNHGKSNINMDWERPVNFEYITPEGKMVINQEAEFCVSGGWSRHFAPASFKIKATRLYEDRNSLDYPFFGDNPYKKYKQILVRNGGNDNDAPRHGRVRDAITQKVLISNGFYIDAQNYQPVHVFFNGEYIGMLNLREPNNKYNGTSSYGYDDDEMDAFEYSNGYFQMAGTKDAFDEWCSLARNAEDSLTYEKLREKLDMDEVINFFAAITYIGCTDWICNNNNVKGYRSLPDGKFHLTLHDQDWGWGNNSALSSLSSYNGNELAQAFNGMRKNKSFQRQFIDSYCLLGGSVFTPKRCITIGDSICRMVEPALAMEGKEPWTSYNEQKVAMSGKPQRAARMTALRNTFGLGEGMAGSFHSNVPQASFMLNGLPVPGASFDGTLFAPVTITADAPAGYVFDGWQRMTSDEDGTEKADIICTERQITMEADADFNLVAVFHRAAEEAPVRINEVSAGNDIYISDYFKRSDWLELYNTTDEAIDLEGMFLSDNASRPQKYEIKAVDGVSTVIPPHETLVVWADGREPISQMHAPFKLGNSDGSVVTLQARDGSWTDVMRYNQHDGRETFGRYPDGGNMTYCMSIPTIDRDNILSTYDFNQDYYIGTDKELQNTFSLAEGWNWFSHNLSAGIDTGLFTNNCSEMRSQQKSLVLDEDNVWTGELNTFSPAMGYKVHAGKTHDVTVKGLAFDVMQPVAVATGWNWIGCPLSNATVLESALGDYRASEGDEIVGQTEFAVYSGGEWHGTLTSVQPGQAYMLKSAMGQAFRWNALSKSRKAQRRYAAQENDDEGEWLADAHAYPEVMNMIATLDCGSEMTLPESYKVAAFCNGECRGVGNATDGQLFMTIHGDAEERISFIVELPDGERYDVMETAMFSPLALMGSVASPYRLTISESTDIVNTQGTSRIKAIRYYTVSGQRLEATAQKGTAGIYIEQTLFEDGSVVSRKIMR